MNRATFSAQEVLEHFGPGNNLGEIFQAIESTYLKKGEVICQFKLNGLALDENDEARLAQIGLHEIEVLEIESQRPELLLFSVLENWIRELPMLIEKSDGLAKEIARTSMDGHLSQFVNLIDSVQLLIDSLISLESVVHKEVISQAELWDANKLKTSDAINQALSAFEARDTRLLGEILEYDIGHCLQVWLDLLRDFHAVLKQHTGSLIR